MTHPTAFISYSWDSAPHREWVARLATRLREDGVAVTLDRWAAVPGDQLPEFMNRAIRENEFVLIVCTPAYRKKSETGKGGVAYEGDIISAEIMHTRNHRKFIPVLRDGEWADAAPATLLGKYYIDFRDDPYAETSYEELLATLHDFREAAPPIGPVPLRSRQVCAPGSAPTAPSRPRLQPRPQVEGSDSVDPLNNLQAHVQLRVRELKQQIPDLPLSEKANRNRLLTLAWGSLAIAALGMGVLGPAVAVGVTIWNLLSVSTIWRALLASTATAVVLLAAILWLVPWILSPFKHRFAAARPDLLLSQVERTPTGIALRWFETIDAVVRQVEAHPEKTINQLVLGLRDWSERAKQEVAILISDVRMMQAHLETAVAELEEERIRAEAAKAGGKAVEERMAAISIAHSKERVDTLRPLVTQLELEIEEKKSWLRYLRSSIDNIRRLKQELLASGGLSDTARIAAILSRAVSIIENYPGLKLDDREH